MGDLWRLHGFKWIVMLVLLAGGAYWIYHSQAGAEAEGWLTVNSGMEQLLTAKATESPGTSKSSAATSATAASIVPVGSTAPVQPSASASLAATNAAPSNGININTASASRLTDLPGIGPSKAKAIVEYRESHGAFAAPEDLMKVKGIGEKTYSALKNRITVQ